MHEIKIRPLFEWIWSRGVLFWCIKLRTSSGRVRTGWNWVRVVEWCHSTTRSRYWERKVGTRGLPSQVQETEKKAEKIADFEGNLRVELFRRWFWLGLINFCKNKKHAFDWLDMFIYRPADTVILVFAYACPRNLSIPVLRSDSTVD